MTEDSTETLTVAHPEERRCSLLLPGLLSLSSTASSAVFAQVGRVSELETFFSRALCRDYPGTALEDSLFGLFDVDLQENQDLPVAAVARVGEGGDGDGQWWLCANPVQLIPDRDQLVLLGPESLGLSQAEADQLVNELNTQLADESWQLEASSPTRWYLRQHHVPQLHTTPLGQVRKGAIGKHMPRGDDGPQWRRLLNEMQMVLHNSVVNRDRQAMGQPSVSSVWFWGGGIAPRVMPSRWSQLWADEPLAQGLASLSSTPRQALPANARVWLGQAIAPGEHLLLLTSLDDCWQAGDLSAWARQVRNFNREWLAPLLDALRENTLGELSIYTCDGRRFILTRKGMRRWWRRKRSLGEIDTRN